MHLLWVGILAATIQQVPQSQVGSIEGTVTTSGAAPTPLAGARVKVYSTDIFLPDAQFPSETTTDGAGRFILRDVPPGSYVLGVNREGYLSGGSGNFTVDLGTRVEVPPVTLAALATIRGRVVDGNGKGLTGARVEFLRLTNDEEGHETWVTGAAAVITDTEGKYERSVRGSNDFYIRATLEKGLSRMSVYYPETTESGAAAPITVSTGEQITADIRIGSVLPAETYEISGRVIRPNSEAGKSALVELLLLKSNPVGPVDQSIRSLPAASLVLVKRNDTAANADPSQAFEFRDTPPGRYDLLANANIDGTDYSARVEVYAGDGDTAGVELVLRPSVEVNGRLIVEGDLSVEGDGPYIKLELIRKDRLPVGVSGPSEVKIDNKGRTFSIRDVPEGDYELFATVQSGEQQPSAHYVADVRAEGRSVFDTGFRVGVDPVDSLEVVIGAQGGSIHGKISGGSASWPSALILVPESFRRSNASLYRVVYSSANAEFKMSGIAPGNYKLFAVPYQNETVPYRSLEFLARHESRAVSVTVQKGVAVEGIQVPFLALGP